MARRFTALGSQDLTDDDSLIQAHLANLAIQAQEGANRRGRAAMDAARPVPQAGVAPWRYDPSAVTVVGPGTGGEIQRAGVARETEAADIAQRGLRRQASGAETAQDLAEAQAGLGMAQAAADVADIRAPQGVTGADRRALSLRARGLTGLPDVEAERAERDVVRAGATGDLRKKAVAAVLQEAAASQDPAVAKEAIAKIIALMAEEDAAGPMPTGMLMPGGPARPSLPEGRPAGMTNAEWRKLKEKRRAEAGMYIPPVLPPTIGRQPGASLGGSWGYSGAAGD